MTIRDHLEAAGVDLEAELPVRVRWSVACGSEGCRFALLQLPSLAVARRRAGEHLEAHAGHDVAVCAETRIPLGGGGS